jgi:tetratricopeptide (TPR) repeat protein
MAPTAFASALCLLCSIVAVAQQDPLVLAKQLMGQRNAAGAYAALVDEEPKRAGDAEFDYWFGVAALDSGHVTRAIFALERAVATRPDDAQARAELGRAYMAAGETESARREFEQVRRTALPPEAAAAIDRVLGLLDRLGPASGPTLSGYLELGAGRDSNVNSASNAGQFAIPAFGGLLFTVAPGSRRTPAAFGTVAAGGGLQWAMSPTWSFLAGANARLTSNRHRHDMDPSVVDASAGVSHAKGAHVATLAFQVSEAWVSSSAYRNAYGLSGQWQSQIDKSSQASAFAQWSRQAYAGQHERDTDRTLLGTGYARQFGTKGPLAYGSLYGVVERADASAYAHHGHRGAGMRIGGEYTFQGGPAAFIEWQHEARRYGGEEPLFDHSRRDRQTDLIAGVRYAIAPNWQLLPKFHYTRAKSNVALYDYSRAVFQITLRRDFR